MMLESKLSSVRSNNRLSHNTRYLHRLRLGPTHASDCWQGERLAKKMGALAYLETTFSEEDGIQKLFD
jgi:hypothetical protein